MTDDEAAARNAIELAPHNAAGWYSLGLLLAQDPARAREAEAAQRKAIALEPNNARYVYRLGLLLHENLQRYEEAEAAYRHAIDLAPDDPFCYSGLVSLLIQQNRRADALAVVEKMRALLSAGEQWYGLAALDSLLGNIDAAIEFLKKAAREDNFNRTWATRDPDLELIRSDPRFGAIVGRDQ